MCKLSGHCVVGLQFGLSQAVNNSSPAVPSNHNVCITEREGGREGERE